MRSTGTGSRPLDRDQLEREQKSRWKSSKGVVTFEAISNIITSSSSSLLHQTHHSHHHQTLNGAIRDGCQESVRLECEGMLPTYVIVTTVGITTYIIFANICHRHFRQGPTPTPTALLGNTPKKFSLWKVFPNHNHHQHQKTVRKKPPRKRSVKDTLKTQSSHGWDEKGGGVASCHRVTLTALHRVKLHSVKQHRVKLHCTE